MSRKKSPKKNYRITIGYKAVISVDIQSSTESEAKELAMAAFTKARDAMFNNGSNIILEDDNFNAHGILDMDKTWNNLYS